MAPSPDLPRTGRPRGGPGAPEPLLGGGGGALVPAAALALGLPAPSDAARLAVGRGIVGRGRCHCWDGVRVVMPLRAGLRRAGDRRLLGLPAADRPPAAQPLRQHAADADTHTAGEDYPGAISGTDLSLEHYLYPQVPSHNLPALSRRLDPLLRAAGGSHARCLTQGDSAAVSPRVQESPGRLWHRPHHARGRGGSHREHRASEERQPELAGAHQPAKRHRAGRALVVRCGSLKSLSG